MILFKKMNRQKPLVFLIQLIGSDAVMMKYAGEDLV